MSSVRTELAEYLDTVRLYAYEIANVKSGIFPTDDPQILLQQPNVWFQKEADWVEVLFEGKIAPDRMRLKGMTANYLQVVASSPEDLTNTLVTVEITGFHSDNNLQGVVCTTA